MGRIYDDPTAYRDWFDSNAPGVYHTMDAREHEPSGPAQSTPASPTANGPGDTGYPAKGGQGDRYSAVAQMYRTALGREATPAEINAWANGPYDIDRIQQEIYQSAEAKAYGAKQSAKGDAAAKTGTPTKADALARLRAARASGDDAAAEQAFNDFYISQGAKPEQWKEYWRDKIMGADGEYYISTKLPQSEALGGGKDGGAADYLAPFTEQFNFDKFSAPTGADESNDPGFKARLKAGNDAIQASAAARGTLLTGNTAKALTDYGQDYASNEFEKVYGRALDTYKTNYNKAFGEYQDRKSTFYSNQDNPFAKLLAQETLDSNNQNYLNGLGLQYAGLFANTSGAGSHAYTDYLTGGANATAAGQVAGGNATANAFSNAGNNALALYYMSQYGKGKAA
jgi:hypothetical protein